MICYLPLIDIFCFRQKGGEHWFVVFNPLLFLWLEQKGKMNFFVFSKMKEKEKFYSFNWYLEAPFTFHWCLDHNLLIEEFVYVLILFLPLCWWLTKRGRKILSFICMLMFMHLLCFNIKNIKFNCLLSLIGI